MENIAPKIVEIVLTKKKDCKGSVAFECKDSLSSLSSIYINRTFVPVATAQKVKVTIEVVN